MERDSEACIVAEGQPRNILATITSRFAAHCRLLSLRCHRVIHSCYVFSPVFRQCARVTRRGGVASVMLNDAQTAGAPIFINSKPQRGLARGG